MKNLELVQQLITKLCHELSGPIGAVNNGIEAFEFSSGVEMDKLNFQMTQRAGEAALARLLFFRAAYGVSRASSNIALLSMHDIVKNYLEELEIKFDIKRGGNVLLAPLDIKIFLCLIWSCGKLLNNGGLVEVYVEEPQMELEHNSTSKILSLKCTGSRFFTDMLKLDILQGKQEDFTDTQEIHAYYTLQLAKESGIVIETDHTEHYFEFTLRKICRTL